MTINQRTRAQLLVALSQHDWEAVDELIGDLAEDIGSEQDALDYFRAHLLPEVALPARQAFWQHAMTPEQYEEFIGNMVDAIGARLEATGFQLGSDFSVGPGVIYLKPVCRGCIEEHYTARQLASLAIVLRFPDV